MFVILIANYTIGELTTDNFHKNKDRIYVLGTEIFTGTAYRLGDRILDRYPEVEKICGVTWGRPVPIETTNTKLNAVMIAVDSTFFDMFSFELLQGDRKHALAAKNSVVLSEKFAKKVFGTFDPIGQIIEFTPELSCTVTGVIEDFENTIFNETDMIIRFENIEHFNSGLIHPSMSNAGSTTLFLQMFEGADLLPKRAEMAEYFKEFFWLYSQNIYKEVTLTPMNELYLSKNLDTDMCFRQGDRTLLGILVGTSILILIFALLNYINLTVAQTSFRAKEMATRRLLGATKSEIFGKMILESTLMSFVSFIIGLFLAGGVEPSVNNLLSSHISVFGNLSLVWVVAYLVFIVILGVISGIMPAIMISRFKPIDTVKGTFNLKSKMTYSKIFIVVQSVITIALIVSSITMDRQVNYMLNADLGYNYKSIINIRTDGFSSMSEINQFRDELRSLPCVKDVAYTKGVPLSRGNNMTMNIDGIPEMISFQLINVDSVGFKMLGIEILKDNRMAESNVGLSTGGKNASFWLNETAIRNSGLTEDSPTLKQVWDGGLNDYPISGVIKDFRLGDISSLWDKKQDCIFQIVDGLSSPWNILVEVTGDEEVAYRQVEQAFKSVTDGSEMRAKYMEQEIAESYEAQERTATIVRIFTLIALIISSLGLLAMATYFIQQRSMEIAVRKVFGSTRKEVLTMLVWKFLRLVVIAFVIACPVVWYFMRGWLNDFSYRISLSPLIFIIAGAFAFIVSFVAVYWQSKRAADANPIDSIKK